MGDPPACPPLPWRDSQGMLLCFRQSWGAARATCLHAQGVPRPGGQGQTPGATPTLSTVHGLALVLL